MIKRSFLIGLLLIGNLFAALQAERRVTIEQCYEWAEENYPLIRKYKLIEQTEKYTLENASRGWLPHLLVSGKATYQSDVTKLPFDSEQLSAVIPGFSIPTLSKDQYQLVGEVNQSIWDGGQIRTGRELAKAQAAADREQVESDLYAIRERVDQLYFGALLQELLRQQNGTLQGDLRVNIDRIEAMIRNGTANQSDLESIQVELLNAQQQEIEIISREKAYRNMLAILTGHDINESTALAEPSILPAVQAGEIKRPELQVFDAQSRLAELQNARITTGLMPQFGLFAQGGYGRPGLNMLEDRFKAYYIAGVRLSWNIGNFYTLKNERRQVALNRQQIEVQRDVFLFNTELQSEDLREELLKMEEILKKDRDIVQLRNSIKEASAVKLENGIISVADLIRDINAEDQARQNSDIHRMQLLMSAYTLRHTRGYQY